MIATIFWAFGLVLIIEGLAFALAPSRMEEILKLMAGLSAGQKRQLGVLCAALGLCLVVIAQVLG
ncbi:MAG: DUF2065 domain-containing protein [Pseudomonadota bacterium]|nr:DUF2065 domain-containing protein [Pseudomonadota bacterium]